MNAPENFKFTESHEWVEDLGDGTYRIGITDFAQSELGDLVYVNLPEEGDALTEGEPFADVESVKAVSEVFSPINGVVSEINSDIVDAPEKINADPYGSWFVVAKDVSFEKELLDAKAYEEFVQEA